MLRLPEGFLPSSLKGGREQTAFLVLAGAVSLVLVSIAASQILLASAIVAAFWLWRKNAKALSPVPPIALPLSIFCLWTLLVIFVSPDVRLALSEAKKFFLYSILFLVPALARGKGTVIWIYRAIFAVSALSCLKGISQFISNPHRGLLDRISGFTSQWMTYSGLLMLVLVALAAFISLYGWRKHKWVVPLSLVLILPLCLSQTRSAQLGALVGVLAVLLMLRKLRAVLVLLTLIVVVYLASPADFRQRLNAGFDMNDPNTRNRIELFGTAVRLIQDHPWVGVGPKNVAREALRYRGSHEWPDWMYQHMHNNFLQIAAERGIPGLLIWLWLMGKFAWDSLRVFRSSGTPRALEGQGGAGLLVSTAALGGWMALVVAGMFEYNFGDSEVLTLFLFMMSAPYAFPLPGRNGLDAAGIKATCAGLAGQCSDRSG